MHCHLYAGRHKPQGRWASRAPAWAPVAWSVRIDMAMVRTTLDARLKPGNTLAPEPKASWSAVAVQAKRPRVLKSDGKLLPEIR